MVIQPSSLERALRRMYRIDDRSGKRRAPAEPGRDGAAKNAKWIGAMAAVLMGRPDAILLTGGMAHSERFVTEITSYISALAPLQVFPGSLEMEAMAEGAFRVLNGQEDPLAY